MAVASVTVVKTPVDVPDVLTGVTVLEIPFLNNVQQ